MGKIYIVSDSYSPGTAPTNRMLAFLNGFNELKVRITIFFLMPDKKHSKLQLGFEYVEEIYLWESYAVSNKYLKYLVGFSSAIKLRRLLRKGDKLFLLGPSFIYLFTGIKGVDVFQERTEHPLAVKNVTMPFDKKCINYIKYCKQLSGLFVISTSLKKFFIENGIQEDKIHIINMIVDGKRFKELNKQFVPDKYIAYCGNASNNKDGVDLLIKAFAIVHKNKPKYKLMIIGKQPLKTDINNNYSLVEDLGVKNYVIFKGIVSSEEMPQLLKNADVVALARPDSLQAQNGFPTKLGEYLLSENPVIVTNVGDIPLFIRDGENGYVVEHNNIEAFANKLIWILDNYEEARQVGKKGAQTAIKEFNYLIETKKLYNVINN